MPHIDIDLLAPFGAKFMEGTNLTPAERAEVLRMAQGFACKDSAAAANVSPETIRARRKRITGRSTCRARTSSSPRSSRSP